MSPFAHAWPPLVFRTSWGTDNHESRVPGPYCGVPVGVSSRDGSPTSAGANDASKGSSATSEGANDAFMLRLKYAGLSITLESNYLSALPRPRFLLRGTEVADLAVEV